MKLLKTIKNIFTSNKRIAINVNSYSQPHVLKLRMKQVKLTHGETIKGDIGPVRIEPIFKESPDMTMFFCPLQDIVIKEQITAGDGGIIPEEVIISGFKNLIPKSTKPGLYNLKNVTLYSNGTMQVIAGEDTIFEQL